MSKSIIIIQWNLRITDNLGPGILSVVRRLVSFGGQPIFHLKCHSSCCCRYTMKNWTLIFTTSNRTIIIISDTSSNSSFYVSKPAGAQTLKGNTLGHKDYSTVSWKLLRQLNASSEKYVFCHSSARKEGNYFCHGCGDASPQ